MELSEFLLARVAEDEAVARAAQIRPADARRVVWYRHDDGWTPSAHGEWSEGQALFDRFDPARVLAECDAKRRIVAEVQDLNLAGGDGVEALLSGGMKAGLVLAMRFLALPYADHSDYDESWRL